MTPKYAIEFQLKTNWFRTMMCNRVRERIINYFCLFDKNHKQISGKLTELGSMYRAKIAGYSTFAYLT